MRIPRAIGFLLTSLLFTAMMVHRGYGQGALLLQDSDGAGSFLNPTGHDSVYFARICAASPTKLRRCEAGELGVEIGRHRGIAGYDWLAVPILPYLYSVEDVSQIPTHVNRETVEDLNRRYHDEHLMGLGANLPEGGNFKPGWNQLVGAAHAPHLCLPI